MSVMVFSSIAFLCAFLPITFAIYRLLPSMTARNWLLIVASLLFYAYGEPVYVLLLLASTVLNYLFGRLVRSERGVRKSMLVVAVITNLGLLGVFKYAGMAVSTVNALLGLSIPVPQIALPLGISFYTFQALSYVIDVYRGDVPPQRNYPRLLLYVAFFPQLVAGPIVKYHDIEAQLEHRENSWSEAAGGLKRFCVGLAKKVLIANVMGQAADALFSATSVSAPLAWLAAFSYLMQIYFDFSAYSDMAIGLGHLFGFTFQENFNYPYCSTSIKEFWRRWHISLSTWFRDYLYIPLGGNRKGRARANINRCIVFLLCGLWHGAAWTFVLWGAIHGALLLLEDAVPQIRKLPRWLGHVYVVLAVTLAFVLFRADSLSQAGLFLSQMFVGWNASQASLIATAQQLTPFYLVAAALAVVGCTPFPRSLFNRVQGSLGKHSYGANALGYVGALVLLAICVLRLSSGTYNPFIYFRF